MNKQLSWAVDNEYRNYLACKSINSEEQFFFFLHAETQFKREHAPAIDTHRLRWRKSFSEVYMHNDRCFSSSNDIHQY